MSSIVTTALLKVVQGKLHWRELRKYGVDVQHYADRWTFGPTHCEPLHATSDDLIQGVRMLLGEPVAISEWARFILAAASIIELDTVESDERGNQLIECLWDLSRGDMQKAKELADSDR